LPNGIAQPDPGFVPRSLQIKHLSEPRPEGLIAARLREQESEFAEDLVQHLGRSVAVYGMICLRTDGQHVLFAQKLEKPASNARKWDLHLLERDERSKLTYVSSE